MRLPCRGCSQRLTGNRPAVNLVRFHDQGRVGVLGRISKGSSKVAKKKRSQALFEVISKSTDKQSDGGLHVPGWMGSSDAQEAPSPGSPPAGPGVRQATMPQAHEPVVSTVGGRLRLSLTYTTCMVAFAVLLLLLAGAFALGRYLASTGGEVIVVSAGEAPEGPDETGGRRVVVAGTGAGTQPPAAVRLYYLVIQNMMDSSDEHRQQADRIVAFCDSRGVPAEVGMYQGDYVVVSRQGFESPDSDAAEEFAQQIEQLGREYLASGGRYNFMQRRRAGESLQPMFLRP